MKRLFLLICFVLLSFMINAQRFTSFSSNPSATIEEMKTFYSTAPDDRKKEGDEIVAKFTEFWNSPWLTGKMQEDFIKTSNIMLKKKMRPFPQFKSYIDAYISFTGNNLAEYSNEWAKIIQFHIENDATTFHNKMNNYAIFFSKNIIFDEANATWKVYGDAVKIGIVKEPFIEFTDVDLVGYSKQDSLTIVGTTGFYYPSSAKWTGKGGEIFWDRAGIGHQVKAKLSDYNIDVRFPKMTAENALLYYPELFANPIKGIVEDKAFLATDEDKATYPRFKSYDNYISIPEIYDNVDYIGGFEMRGASIMGASDGTNLAKLYIKKKGKIIVFAESKSFLFKTESVLADEARVRIYVDKDSIYHPAANLKYTESTKELLISRPKNGIGRTPFFDSYHKLDITAESIFWKTDEERIEFKPIAGNTSESSAIFESQNYFNYSIMKDIQGYNDISPLFTLWELFQSYSYENIPFQRVVAYFKNRKMISEEC